MALSRSYKNLKLLDLRDLEAEAQLLSPIFIALWERRKTQEISDAEFCTLQTFLFLISRRKKQPVLRWVVQQKETSCSGMKIKNMPELRSFLPQNLWPCISELSLMEMLQKAEFICIPGGIQNALLYWMSHPEKIDLQLHIPSPEEVLELQSQGRRCVGTFLSKADLSKYHHGKEAFEFLLHDLEHADKFFSATQTHDLQTRFFSKILHKKRQGFFEHLLNNDFEFQKQFDYLMSDMNSHPSHLENYLRAIILNSFLRSENKQPHEELSPYMARDFKSFMEQI